MILIIASFFKDSKKYLGEIARGEVEMDGPVDEPEVTEGWIKKLYKKLFKKDKVVDETSKTCPTEK